MNFFIQRSELRDLYDKVAGGEHISEADALRFSLVRIISILPRSECFLADTANIR